VIAAAGATLARHQPESLARGVITMACGHWRRVCPHLQGARILRGVFNGDFNGRERQQ
jgi:hypothetical protein